MIMESVRLKNFGTYAEAELAKNLLEKLGVKARVQKGNNLNTLGEYTGFGGDADLFIFEKDFDKANDILKNDN